MKRPVAIIVALGFGTTPLVAQTNPPIIVPANGATPPATPAGQQQLINGTFWVNGGRGAVNGANWRDNYQIIHDILNGMGTWNPSGQYTPQINGQPPQNVLLPHVSNNAAIAGYANVLQPVVRDGYATIGDGGSATYVHSVSACAAPDGGAQIGAVDGGCWNIDAKFVTPQIFGARGDGVTNDVIAITACGAASALLHITCRIPGATYFLGSAFVVAPGMNIKAEPGAGFKGNNTTLGVQLSAGNYSSVDKIDLPTISGFVTDLQLYRAALARVHVPALANATVGVQITSDGTNNALDNIIDVDDEFALSYGNVITGTTSTDTLQGNRFEVNFVTNVQKPYAYTGTICNEDGNSFVAEAVDIGPTNGGGGAIVNEATPAATNPNANGSYVPRATFMVREWFGGAGFNAGTANGPSQLVKGKFIQLIYDVRSTQTWLNINRTDPYDWVSQSEIRFHTNGQINATIAADTTGNLANFNGGQKIFSDSASVTYTNTSSIAPGGYQDFFVYVGFPDFYTGPWTITQFSGGVISTVIPVAVYDESISSDGRLRIRVMNVGASAVAVNTPTQFRLQRSQ